MTRRRELNRRAQRRVQQETEELCALLDALHDVNKWTRAELQIYLEHTGHAVYDWEDTETLREAVRSDMDNLPWEER